MASLFQPLFEPIFLPVAQSMAAAPVNGGGAHAGFTYLTDENGGYLTDENGERIIGDVIQSSASLREIARSKGILLGTSIQSPEDMSAPGPSGYATRMDWIRDNFDLYTPGYVMQGDFFHTGPGQFNTGPAAAFIADAVATGKEWVGHVFPYYGKRDLGTWLASYLTSGNWQATMLARASAIAALPHSQTARRLEPVNELFAAGSANPGGWRDNPWTAAAGSYTAPALYAFQIMEDLFPGIPLYWCQDQIEQLGQAAHANLAANYLNGVNTVRGLGANVAGLSFQFHETYRLGFNSAALRSLLRDAEQDGLGIVISELDGRTGFSTAPGAANDTLPPSSYTTAAYDRQGAYLLAKAVDVAGPFVKASGKQLSIWTGDDGYTSWRPSVDANSPAGERPTLFDANFQPKPQYHAVRQALLEL